MLLREFKRHKCLFYPVFKPFKIPPWFYWILLGVLLVAPIVLWVSHWETQVLQDWTTLQHDPQATSDKKFDASLEIVKAIVGGVGTLATIGGGVFVLWNIQLTQTRLITERFAKAVEQLGSDKLEVRLGSIYALERIAYDSDRDHWTIMEILTSFIQEKSPIKPITEEQIRAKAYEIWQAGSKEADKEIWDSAFRTLLEELMTKDIQAALTVIGRRQKKDRINQSLNLRHTRLSLANLESAHLSRINLIGADLFDSTLYLANLESAHLKGANLSYANLKRADLNGAYLSGADLHNADMSGANLERANFRNANLCNADFHNADMSGANLRYADMSGARGLTAGQLKDAKLCDTILPAGINLDPNRDCKA